MSAPQRFPFSPLTSIFPPWSREHRERLRVDFAAHGLREPIAVWRGQVVDGRHRYEVCTRLGVAPEYLFLNDDADPVALVISKNAIRRHLDETQSTVVAFRLAQASGHGRQGQGASDGEIFPRRLTQREAARLMGVSDRLVKHPARVLSPQSRAVPERICLTAKVLVVDEFGIWPYDRDAATAFFTLVSARYACPELAEGSGAASPSRPTRASASGASFLATRSSPRRSWTGCCTTAMCRTSGGRATGAGRNDTPAPQLASPAGRRPGDWQRQLLRLTKSLANRALPESLSSSDKVGRLYSGDACHCSTITSA